MISLEPPRAFADATDPWRALGLSHAGLSRFLRSAQTASGLRGDVGVLLADDRSLRRLNREFRGKNQATDVLSFPAPEAFAGSAAGDLAISLETAARQAEEHGHTLRDEVRILLLHGVLHLTGLDHETDRGEMETREAELRRRLRLPTGLIARAKDKKPARATMKGTAAHGPEAGRGRGRQHMRDGVARRRVVSGG